MPVPEFDEYWQLRMEAMVSRLKAAQKIVSHPGTRGNLAENLLRELIRDFLPQRWAAGTGFIIDEDLGRSSQIDLLIYDSLASSPIYRDGDLVILSPGTARVAAEVKSQPNSEEIPTAFSNISSSKRIDPDLSGLVFGYDGVQVETFCSHVRTWASRPDAPTRSRWPDRVYNLAQAFLMFPSETGADGMPNAETRYIVAKAIDPVVRFFITQVLTRLDLTNLRAFMSADKTGDELESL